MQLRAHRGEDRARGVRLAHVAGQARRVVIADDLIDLARHDAAAVDQLRDERRRRHDLRQLDAPVLALVQEERAVVAVQHDDLLRARGGDGLRGPPGLSAHVLDVADHVAQLAAGGRLIREHGEGHARLFEDGQQRLRHIRHGVAGGVAQPDERLARLRHAGQVDLRLRRAVGVARRLEAVDDLLGEVRHEVLKHGLRAALADEDERIKARHAVRGARAAQQAFVHRHGAAPVHLHAALEHGHLQSLGAGGVVLLAGHQLHRAQVTAHVAEAARVRVLFGFFAEHDGCLLVTVPACRGS